MECPKCKFDNTNHEKYCINCGTLLKIPVESRKKNYMLPFILFLIVFLIFYLLIHFGYINLQKNLQRPIAIQTLDYSGWETMVVRPSNTSTEEIAAKEEYSLATPTNEEDSLTGKIIFTCQVDKKMNHDQICSMSTDGSNWKQLTTSMNFEHYYASPSTDGSKIVFSSSLSNGFDIFIMNSDGSGLQQLTSGLGEFYAPALSPDGLYIVATRHINGVNFITLLKSDGTYIADLNSYHDCKDPVWSPDGNEILFAANPSKTGIQIFVMDSDGNNVRQLTNMEGLRGRVDWSVEGVMASYTGEYENHNRELFLFGKDKSPEIITDGGDNLAPSFSPDGKWITFMSYRDNFWDPDGCEIYIMRLEDGFTKRLTNNDYCDYQPRWSK